MTTITNTRSFHCLGPVAFFASGNRRLSTDVYRYGATIQGGQKKRKEKESLRLFTVLYVNQRSIILRENRNAEDYW